MGRVADELLKVVRRQVDGSGIVVWYDPERTYEDIASATGDANTTFARYVDSFFQLRYEIDHLLEGDRPRLVVYVPLPRDTAHEPLIELVAAGVEMYPGAPSRPCNTRLSVIAKPLFDEMVWKSVEKGVEAGTVGLADLDRLAERPTGMLSLLFGTASPDAIALEFVTSDKNDTTVTQKGAESELAALLEEHFGFQLPEGSLVDVRDRFVQHVLATELVSTLPGETPSALASVAAADIGPLSEACVSLSRTWRLRSDLTDSFAAAAHRTESALSLPSLPVSYEQLQSQDAFLALEERLQEEAEGRLRTSPDEATVDLARSRQRSFWSKLRPDVGARWVMIATAGDLLLTADRIAAQLKARARSANEILTAYTARESNWCLLDTYQRRLETLAFGFDWDEGHQALGELRHHAANRFAEVGGALAEAFVRAYQAEGFTIAGLKRQRDVFKQYVAPAVVGGKTAYVLVDALRFEMARELVAGLGEEFDCELDFVLGSVPSITEVGMAALLPGAEGEVELLDAGGGKLALRIDGTVVKDRPDRVKLLKANAGATVYDAKLEDLLANRKAVLNGIAGAELVLVTSQEIDLLCEQGNIALARNTMDTVIRDLRRGIGALVRQGVQTVIVTADHGYLFGEEAGTDMTIDPPGGETVDMHRRVWVGRGGAAHSSCVRLKASDLGWKGSLEIVSPWNMACFRAGGARAYFHGGLAPQELAVPVAVLRARVSPRKPSATPFAWQLKSGAKTISTRFLSVRVEGQVSQLFDADAPRVRIEVRAGGIVVSTPLTADYGLDPQNGEVGMKLSEDGRSLESNVVVLQLHESAANADTASVHLLDAASGFELAKLASIPVRIAL